MKGNLISADKCRWRRGGARGEAISKQGTGEEGVQSGSTQASAGYLWSFGMQQVAVLHPTWILEAL